MTYLTLEDTERPIETLAAYLRRYFVSYQGEHWHEREFLDLLNNFITCQSEFNGEVFGAYAAPHSAERQESLRQSAAALAASVVMLTEKLTDIPRVTEEDFERLQKIKDRVDELRKRNLDRRERLGLDNE